MVQHGGNGNTTVDRLPADDDPQMQRVDMIREREEMFVDTLNQYYEGFYMRMWEPYENWRRQQQGQRTPEQETRCPATEEQTRAAPQRQETGKARRRGTCASAACIWPPGAFRALA